jgi:ketosteroid isomerase-like protein
MRKLIAVTLVTALCAVAMSSLALAKDQPGSAPDQPNLPGPLSRTVMQAYSAYLKGNVDGIVELTTDDVEWGGVGPEGYGAPFGDYHGHDGVRRWFRELASASGPYALTDLEFHEDGNSVWVSGTQATTFTNGRMEAGPFAHFFKFKNGKISSFWNFLDSASALSAAGGDGGMSCISCDPAMAMNGMPMALGGMSMSGMPMPAMPMSAMSMDHSPTAGGMDETAARNIDGLKAGYAAFAAGDLDTLANYFTDDIVWEAVGPANSLPIFGHFAGKEATLNWFKTVGAMMDCEPFRDVQFIASGDTVVAWGRSRVTFRQTGKVVDSPFVHVARFRDGKIYWYECLEDTAADVMAAQ